MPFVGKPIVPEGGGFGVDALGRFEPVLPRIFRFGEELLTVSVVQRSWRSTKDDRGDTYLKRHWFQFTSGTAAPPSCISIVGRGGLRNSGGFIR
jgi:hypothetical protein